VTRSDVPSSPRSRLARRLLVAVTAVAGLVFYRYAFATIRTVGWRGWPLALLLCVLAAAAWQLVLSFSRPSRTVRTHTSSGEEETAHERSHEPSSTHDTPTSS
jgi:hypothetical protein